MIKRNDQLCGLLLGTAVGDAIGLPREGLSVRRATRIFGGAPLRHRLVFGRGMVSDDTEHACMTAQALIRSGGEPSRFARSLAWRLRWWLVALPAGVGMATAKAVLRLWIGFPPSQSGVRSEGNGPAMRAPIIGAFVADEPVERLVEFVNASTRLTHRTTAAEEGAVVIALAARRAILAGGAAIDLNSFNADLKDRLTHERLRSAVLAATEAARFGEPPKTLLETLDVRRDSVSGWMLQTVPVAIYCWLRHPLDFRPAVEEVVLLGGDTDTTAAIVGALVGASVGVEGIPAEWLNGLTEWPRSRGWIASLADSLAGARGGDETPTPLPLFWPAVPLRNLLFLLIVLVHGLRRLFPPY
jgi:ADP-ribosyl-[dinitrogen reductase] hydrolase